MAFSATESAFEGFRIVRRSPMTIVFWALAYLAVIAAFVFLAGNNLPAFLEAAETLDGATEPTPEQMLPFFQAYAAMVGPMLPISIVLGAMLNAAVARAVVRPSESALGYLRIGMDELRVFVVTLVLGIIIGLLAVVALFVMAAVVGGLALAFGGDNPGPAILIGIACYVLWFAFIIWLSVRFSLAVPITVAERRFAIFDSWGMTKGHVWSLIGMTILAFVLAIVVQILISVVALPIVYFATDGFSALGQIEGMTPMEVFQTMAPLGITVVIVSTVLSALQLAIMYAPYASAYMGLTGGRVQGQDPRDEGLPEV